MELIEEKLKTVTSYHGVIVNVRLDEARLPDGSTAKREVVEHPGGVTVLPHKPGSLYKVLSRFYALGINLNKLESRPLPERDFEFMFYFDLETSVYSPQFRQLMGELPGLCETLSYLGSYQEVV